MAVYQSKETTGCYRFFGVRSHLHHFYECGDQPQNSNNINQQQYLLANNRSNCSKRCSPTVWKVLIWLGILLLIIGAALILIGRFFPRKELLRNAFQDNDRYAILDKYALRINDKLDIVEIAGIIVFVVGGVLLLAAAILPAFLMRTCVDDVADSDGSNERLLYSTISSDPPSPTKPTATVSTLVKQVQPLSKRTSGPIDATSDTYTVIE